MSKVWIGKKEFFPGIKKIAYEGAGSDNPLAFKFYDADKKVGGKTMKEHLRFAVAYWHSFCANGGDPFGSATQFHAWDAASDPLQRAYDKADAAFEFTTKLGAEYYCFHDVDASPDAEDPAVYEKNFQAVTKALKERQDATGVKLLWNTANLFSHPRYMNGASTNPDFKVVARGAHQVKCCLDANVVLGGSNYVFWGGREGYSNLWNTDMKREQEHLGRFLTAARDYGRSIGFKGVYLIEPKPMEPSKHQYDFDAATVIGFLKAHGLDKDFKLNIEANHATLAGHEFWHDLQVSADAGMLGSVDANRGDAQNGWDTDQFPTDLYETTKAMLVVLQAGGLGLGGLNFDAKIRRNSTDLEDLFLAHIGGMDAFARGAKIAAAIRKDGVLSDFVKKRYSSYDAGIGKKIEEGTVSSADLEKYMLDKGNPDKNESGRQELLENIVNQHL